MVSQWCHSGVTTGVRKMTGTREAKGRLQRAPHAVGINTQFNPTYCDRVTVIVLDSDGYHVREYYLLCYVGNFQNVLARAAHALGTTTQFYPTYCDGVTAWC
jgi:hypothetical protein